MFVCYNFEDPKSCSQKLALIFFVIVEAEKWREAIFSSENKKFRAYLGFL